MKSITKTLLLTILFICVSGLAYGQTFTLANNNGGDGYIVGAAPVFQLFGAQNAVGPNYTTYSTSITAPTTLTFNWSYTTYDCCGSGWDPAGYFVNGNYTQLSTDSFTGGEINSSGIASIVLNIGDTFGWYVYSLDSVSGPGELDVNATPEPGTLILFGTGLMGAVGAIRRKFMV